MGVLPANVSVASHAHRKKNTKTFLPRELGGSQILFYPKSYLIDFLTYNSMQNFITLGQPLLGEKYVTQKEKENNTNYSGLCSAAMPKGKIRRME